MRLFGYDIKRSADSDSENEIFKKEFALALDEWGHNDSTRYVTHESSLSMSAVWACVRIISDTVASLPINVYEKTASGRERNSNHSAYEVLHNPNRCMNRFVFFKTLLTHTLLWGNGYAEIIRGVYYQPVSMIIHHPSKVSTRIKDGELYFFVDGRAIQYHNMIHVMGVTLDGIIGKSPIAVHRENLELAFSAQAYGKKFFDKGGNTSGVIEYPGSLDDDAFKRLKAQIDSSITGLQNAHKPMLLEGGMKYNRVSIPLEDAQFIATRKFQKTEIATIYGVPPHMIADLDRATNNNIEQQAIEFVRYCLNSYVSSLECEYQDKLFLTKERGKMYASYNLNAILRGDQKARAEFYRTMFYIGAYTPNEVRALEDMNSYLGGDEHFIQTNMGGIKNILDNGENK